MKIQGLVANVRTGETFVIERESDCDCPACAMRLHTEIVDLVNDMSFLERCLELPEANVQR